ncbi:MAG: putative rane protein yhfA [Blastococcus sp.]|nr:putative rane protein yhfA [Blastococcus sp.]
MDITFGHWVYLAGLASIIIAMAMRKNVVVPAIIATFLTTIAFTGSLPRGISSVFQASLASATELFSMFLIIALITAMVGALTAIGAERKMIQPLTRLMINGPVAYIALFLISYVFSLFFWPTPTLALLAATLVPAAVRAGLSPMGAAIALALAGQGMALASDYVIGIGPSLAAEGAGVAASDVANRALVISWIVGGVAAVMCYFMTVRRSSVARVTRRVHQEAGVGGRGTAGPTTDNPVETAVADADRTDKDPADGRLGNWSPAGGADSTEPPQTNPMRARLFAIMVPLVFGSLLVYMLLGRFTDLVTVDAGVGASLVGGAAALILLLIALNTDGWRSLETYSTHIVSGLTFAFKNMGVVIPVAGFVFMGISGFSSRIMGLGEDTEGPAFLFDAITRVQASLPDIPIVVTLAVLLAGMVVGLDGNGWAGLPLIGSLSDAVSPAAGEQAATLAAIGMNGALWTGGGTLVIWSTLIAVATFCGVSVVELARRLFLPVVTGLVVGALAATVLW